MIIRKESLLDRVLNKLTPIKLLLQKLGIRDTREREQEFRVIYVNNVKPDDYTGVPALEYSNNRVITSKYTLWNFLPKNLYEQFRRVANFYFLVNIIITFLIPDPPKNPITGVIPLATVVIFTAIKQAYEDILRHIADAEINRKTVTVIRNGNFVQIKREDIRCGDIVEVKADTSFPCDILLLYSQTEEGACHITTANLDGETNLKKRSVPQKMPPIKSHEDLFNFRATIKCDKPNTELYEFKGKIQINNVEYPLRNENILLRGCTLKISPVIYGCAIYTGKDTKLMLNSKFKPSKLSQVERTLNKFILFFIGLLAICLIIGLIGSIIYRDVYFTHWYLRSIEPKYFLTNRPVYYLFEVLFYLSLLSNLIPISMYVSIETQRFIGTKFFEWDLKMYDEKTNQTAKANNSDINEDLGQVEYLFSDKTGTLTENEMIFKQFSLDGVVYTNKDSRIFQLESGVPEKLNDEKFKKLFEVLSLCHTVQLDRNAAEIYQASSPDEYSFVKFCEKIGIAFLGDTRDPHNQTRIIRSVKYLDKAVNYELMHTLEFDSDRKRMSVILRCLNDNKYLLLTKGAENSVFAKCTHGKVDECNDTISEFARQGWRTLALAYRYINQADMDLYNELLNEAYNDMSDRSDERLRQIFEEIESNLNLIGATAVEDRLQEDVSRTLYDLRKAGIKIWVLTGDKRETAINISNSCKHFSPEMEKLSLTDANDINFILNKLSEQSRHIKKHLYDRRFAYIIDGRSLSYIFKFEFQNIFREICMECDAVLCCRMSPSQKAQVVKLVKKSSLKPVTCAIGDGANDVSMIQEAHIGFGIFGKEGRNAARSADFAFAKFKHLRRALLVHGYLYYTRIATLVNYFFYKNLAFVICQIYYASYNAYSASSLYHSMFITFYNIAYTAFPIIAFALFEQKSKIKDLEKKPELYKTIRLNELLSVSQFLKWNFLALWHSLVAYFTVLLLYRQNHSISAFGLMDGDVEFGSIVFMQILIMVHLKLLMEWSSISYITLISYSLSVVSFVVLSLIPNSFIAVFPFTIITEGQRYFWIFYHILGYPSVWLCFFVTAAIALIPDLFIKIIENLLKEIKFKSLEIQFMQKDKRKFEQADVPDHYQEQLRKREELKRKKHLRNQTVSNEQLTENADVFSVDAGLSQYDTSSSQSSNRNEFELTSRRTTNRLEPVENSNRPFNDPYGDTGIDNYGFKLIV